MAKKRIKTKTILVVCTFLVLCAVCAFFACLSYLSIEGYKIQYEVGISSQISAVDDLFEFEDFDEYRIAQLDNLEETLKSFNPRDGGLLKRSDIRYNLLLTYGRLALLNRTLNRSEEENEHVDNFLSLAEHYNWESMTNKMAVYEFMEKTRPEVVNKIRMEERKEK